jgi:hypothetical protein
VLLEGCQKDANVGAVEAREPGMTTIYLSSFLSWATGSLVDWNRPWLWLRLSILTRPWRLWCQLAICTDFRASATTSDCGRKWGGDKFGYADLELLSRGGLPRTRTFTPTCISCRKSPLVTRTIETMKLSDVLMQYSLPTRRGMIAGKSGRVAALLVDLSGQS